MTKKKNTGLVWAIVLIGLVLVLALVGLMAGAMPMLVRLTWWMVPFLTFIEMSLVCTLL